MTRRLTTRTRWRDKLYKDQPARIVNVPPPSWRRFGGARVVIPRPLDVDALIRRVPRGRLATLGMIRSALARRYRADSACPLCTGIFLRIAAEAAEEARAAGRRRISPWWRVVREDGRLNERLPGGAAEQARRLRAEKHRVAPARGRGAPRVVDFDAVLTKL